MSSYKYLVREALGFHLFIFPAGRSDDPADCPEPEQRRRDVAALGAGGSVGAGEPGVQ